MYIGVSNVISSRRNILAFLLELNINILSPSGPTLEAGTVTFTGSVNGPDTITTLEYQIDGGAFTSFTVAENWSVDIPIGVANTSVTIRATDDQLETATDTHEFTAEDTTAPVPGGDGVLTTSNITDSGFTIGFTKATDNAYAQSELVYKLYTGELSALNDVDQIESQTLVDQGTDVDEFVIENAPGSGDYGVLVEDPEGNKAVYDAVLISLLEPIINTFISSPQSIQQNPDSNGVIEDIGTTGFIEWVIQADDASTSQMLATPVSLDESIIVLSNIDKEYETLADPAQVTGRADYEIVGEGGEEDNNTFIEITADFGGFAGQKIDVPVTRNQYEEVNESDPETFEVE